MRRKLMPDGTVVLIHDSRTTPEPLRTVLEEGIRHALSSAGFHPLPDDTGVRAEASVVYDRHERLQPIFEIGWGLNNDMLGNFSYHYNDGTQTHRVEYSAARKRLSITRQLAFSLAGGTEEGLRALEKAVENGIQELVITLPPLSKKVRTGEVIQIDYLD